jgi:hypothetical protein
LSSRPERININEDVAYKIIMTCINVVELRNTGKYLDEVRCKWENKIGNL